MTISSKQLTRKLSKNKFNEQTLIKIKIHLTSLFSQYADIRAKMKLSNVQDKQLIREYNFLKSEINVFSHYSKRLKTKISGFHRKYNDDIHNRKEKMKNDISNKEYNSLYYAHLQKQIKANKKALQNPFLTKVERKAIVEKQHKLKKFVRFS